MQLFIKNVSFAATETDLELLLAAKLHQPPFSTDPPINFHVELFSKSRNGGHKGIGLLTLPTADSGEKFLRLYGSIEVKHRMVQFSRSTGRPNDALIQRLRTSPWQDPQKLREEKQKMADASSPIPLASFSFGRFCRDGVFSVEVDGVGDGKVVCDMTLRQVHLSLELGNKTRGRTPTAPFDLFGDFFGATTTVSVRYPSPRITAMASSTNGFCVFIESDLPPTFERQMSSIMSTIIDKEPLPQRLSSLHSDHQMPPVCQGLCLTFETQDSQRTFLERCRVLHLPRPFNRDIRLVRREIYAKDMLANLNTFLGSLEFGLAFAVEKAVSSGVLEPRDVLESLRRHIVQLQNDHGHHAAPIFRSFTATLVAPSLISVPAVHGPRRRGRNRRQRNAMPPNPSLSDQLNEATLKYITDLNRPKGRFSPSPAIYQSYHVIITPSIRILEGPLPDQSNSVLRRFENHDCFLRVSFQDEGRSPPRRDPSLAIDDLLGTRYKRILVGGMHLAGRSYEFLGYSMSGLKEYSFYFVTPFVFNGSPMNAAAIRDRLGDFSGIAYKPALLGARWSQAFSASDPSVTLNSDEIQQIDDRCSVEKSVFTDGCGTISPKLARAVWSKLQRTRRTLSRSKTVPSCFQFRLGGAKGVLVQDSTLPGKVVCLRPSQTKFDAAAIRTLDIAATSSRPMPVFLNRPLIVLLEYHRVDHSAIISLQESAIREVQKIQNSLPHASTMFETHGLGQSFRLPSLFRNIDNQLGMDIQNGYQNGGIRHQLIKTSLAYATTNILREIKHRARILVPGSFTLIGVSDERCCLREGEIYATVHDERTGRYQAIEGRVLITRSPQIHPGDVQFATAVRRPELAHLTNVVVFSCEGSRSLPSCLGGGDLDGDVYNLILDPNLFPPSGRTSTPGAYIPLPHKTTKDPCTVADVADFVIDFIKSDLLGYISILHLRIADLKDPNCEDCLKLAEKASHAVDFKKTGTLINFKDLPYPPDRMRPDFLSGEGINPATGSSYYPSAKLLGKLYRSVPIEDYRPDPADVGLHPTDGDEIISALNDLGLQSLGLPRLYPVPNEELLEEMDQTLDEYCQQLLVIAKTHTISRRPNDYLSEAELVSGTIQARWPDHHKRREAVTAMNLQTHELTAAIRHEFRAKVSQPEERDSHHEGDGQDDDQDDYDDYDYYFEDEYDDDAYEAERRMEIFRRAWAAWIIAEEALRYDPGAYGPQSFGLIALGTMLEVVKEARRLV